MHIHLRLAQEKDIPQLTMLKKPWAEPQIQEAKQQQEKRLDEQNKGNAAYLLAEHHDTIFGHVLVKFLGKATEPNFPDLEDLFVREDMRGKGIATLLLEKAQIIAQEKGFDRIGISVNPTLNPKAKVLYKRLGFQDTKTPSYVDDVYNGVEDWVIDMVKIFR